VLIDDGRGFQGVGVGVGVGVGEEFVMQPYNFVSRISQQRGGSQLLHGATGCGGTYYLRHSRNSSSSSSSVKAYYCKSASPESKSVVLDLLFYVRSPRPQKHAPKVFI
jgi:hypothetical protein